MYKLLKNLTVSKPAEVKLYTLFETSRNLECYLSCTNRSEYMSSLHEYVVTRPFIPHTYDDICEREFALNCVSYAYVTEYAEGTHFNPRPILFLDHVHEPRSDIKELSHILLRLFLQLLFMLSRQPLFSL